MKIFSLFTLMLIGVTLSSFQDKTCRLSLLLTDTSATIHARLGKTKYYVEKPIDCIEDVMQDQPQESCYGIYQKDNSTGGKCTITIDKEHHDRKSKVKVATYFNDDILGHNISIQEYSNGKEFIRTGELEDNGEFLYFECFGKTKEILEKYFTVVKSLSYKAK